MDRQLDAIAKLASSKNIDDVVTAYSMVEATKGHPALQGSDGKFAFRNKPEVIYALLKLSLHKEGDYNKIPPLEEILAAKEKMLPRSKL